MNFVSFIESLTAVSYTHLDVYKRQGIGGAELWAAERIEANVIKCTGRYTDYNQW